jgi:hypothetical protein
VVVVIRAGWRMATTWINECGAGRSTGMVEQAVAENQRIVYRTLRPTVSRMMKQIRCLTSGAVTVTGTVKTTVEREYHVGRRDWRMTTTARIVCKKVVRHTRCSPRDH